ncbi:hypothetical protein EJ04DRAFT_404139, partial [Polyplosphaeria fusca]
RHWRWEILFFLVGTGGFAGIVSALVKYKNWDSEEHSLPYLEVSGHEIRFPAIFATLSQLTQSALLVPTASCVGQLKWSWFQRERRAADLDRFDLASRGPWGSIKLL